jgi:protein phosphatase 1 regulatory subunit 11
MGRGSHRQRKHGQEEFKGYVSMIEADVVCCIYHKPRMFGESSSDESSSSSSDDSDSEADIPSRRQDELDHPNGEHDHPNGDEPCVRHSKRSEKRKRKPSPNAYERRPQHPRKKEDQKKPEGSGTIGR